MPGIVVDNLPSLLHPRSDQERFAGVEITVEAWKVAARDVEPDSMTCLEDVAGRPQVDRVLIDRPGNDGISLLHRVAIAGSHNAVGQEAGVSIWLHVHQHRWQIGVEG